jgi:hypothetical protein
MKLNKSFMVLISYLILFALLSIILNPFHLNIDQNTIDSIITISSTLLSIGFALWIVLITAYSVTDDAYFRGKLIRISDILLGLNVSIAITTGLGVLSISLHFLRTYTVSSITCNIIIGVICIILLRKWMGGK